MRYVLPFQGKIRKAFKVHYEGNERASEFVLTSIRMIIAHVM